MIDLEPDQAWADAINASELGGPTGWVLERIAAAVDAVVGKGRRAGFKNRLTSYLNLASLEFRPAASQRAFWSLGRFAAPLSELIGIRGPADVIVAVDWPTLPVCRLYAERTGARLIYDSHELAAEEFSDNLVWRIFRRPLIKAIEREHLPACDLVFGVSERIVRTLKRRYGLGSKAQLLLNVPYVEERPPAARPSDSVFRVLYQGVLAQGRLLGMLIEAMALLEEGFQLTIRGPEGVPGYADELQGLIQRIGVGPRVRIEPPVHPNLMIQSASAHDCGVILLRPDTLHNQFALPNKLFEYMAAGLAICASDLPEMRRVVRKSGAGVLVPTWGGPRQVAKGLRRARAHHDFYRSAARDSARYWSFQECGAIAALQIEALLQRRGT